MDKKKIDRINELAKKARSSDGLTPEEMTERAKLREEYLNAIRQNFKQTLDNIEIIDKRRIKNVTNNSLKTINQILTDAQRKKQLNL